MVYDMLTPCLTVYILLSLYNDATATSNTLRNAETTNNNKNNTKQVGNITEIFLPDVYIRICLLWSPSRLSLVILVFGPIFLQRTS